MKKKENLIKKAPKNKTGFAFSVIHKVVPLLIILFSMILATQKCAREINYDVQIIGRPSFIFKGEPIYPFYRIVLAYFIAMKKANLIVGNIIYENSKIIVMGSISAVLSYVFLAFIRNTINKDDKNFLTTNRWGVKKDLEEAGLLANCGVVIGQGYNAKIDASMEKGGCVLKVKKCSYLIQYYMSVCGMVLAGTRLGKGVSTIVPTHMNFPGSIISIDPKGENFKITAGWRKQFSYVYKYCPTSRETLKFNILDEIDEQFAFRDANMIAEILTSSSNPNANIDPHWQETAKVLITAAILHCKCSDYCNKSLPGVYKFLSQGITGDDKTVDAKKEVLNKMLSSIHCTAEIHQSIKSYANQILSAANEEMGSIFSAALEALSVFNDPIVANSVSTSDFCLDDFKYSDIPISWYLTIPFSDLDRLKSLIRLFIEFICRKFSQNGTSHGKEALKNKLLFIIDEFPTLGRMETIENFAGILNGYGISFLWVVQSKAQIDKLYGQNAPIIEHCRFMWTYAVNDANVAEYFAKRIGEEGVIKQNSTSSGNRYDLGMNNMSVNSDITKRSLLTANEIENLPPDCELLFTQGAPAQLCKKVAYYSDPRFKDKANLPYPETRFELLKETRTSRVLRDGDDKWWTRFDEYGDDNLNYYEELTTKSPVILKFLDEENYNDEEIRVCA